MGIKSFFLILTGCVCLAAGAAGLFIPVLPTTPFVLLAAGCFGGSSPKMYNWLAGTRQFGSFIANYRTGAGVEKGIKIKSLIFLWIMMATAIYLSDSMTVRCILGSVGTAVTVHILMMKTKK